MKAFFDFIGDEDGAATIDWVALAAMVLLLSVGIIPLMQDEFSVLVGTIQTELDEQASAVYPYPN